jgi:hypothetical protein
MTDEQWFNEYDLAKGQFQWFFREYGFMKQWAKLCIAREFNNKEAMLVQMDYVWFKLPDHIFNIKVNPVGWQEFLNLVER